MFDSCSYLSHHICAPTFTLAFKANRAAYFDVKVVQQILKIIQIWLLAKEVDENMIDTTEFRVKPQKNCADCSENGRGSGIMMMGTINKSDTRTELFSSFICRGQSETNQPY